MITKTDLEIFEEHISNKPEFLIQALQQRNPTDRIKIYDRMLARGYKVHNFQSLNLQRIGRRLSVDEFCELPIYTIVIYMMDM